jgi:hypothetical protein
VARCSSRAEMPLLGPPVALINWSDGGRFR